ncbi:MAG: L-dopachrome tautomerase-related protein [Deinococcus sp.]
MRGLLVDGRDRLWVLDTGTGNLGPTLDQRAPRQVGTDTRTDRVIRTIHFPANVVLNNTHLNDLRQGKGGVAYITNSGAKSGGGIIVVDLASGHSWRKLTGDRSVWAEPTFVPMTDGNPLYLRPKAGVAHYLNLSSDGVAISPDGGRLYHTLLASRRLYSVPTAALHDEGMSAATVSVQVRDLREEGVSDGLGEDTAGNVYTTNYEQNAVMRRLPDGELRTVVRDPRLICPDTLPLHGGYLYVVSNQLNRQGAYHWGRDLRKPPYALFRVRVDTQPVILK